MHHACNRVARMNESMQNAKAIRARKELSTIIDHKLVYVPSCIYRENIVMSA